VYAVTGCDPAPPFRKLYVTRRNAKVRRLVNEVEVADYLTDRGFEVVALEERPFREQVQLFAEAEVVVAQHGAGLTNLLFAQSPRVLEIMSDQDRQIYFNLISQSRGFAHKQVHMNGTDKNDDVTVPLEVLEAALSSMTSA
jgi:capsular polysaccharide biosynthesis protein